MRFSICSISSSDCIFSQSFSSLSSGWTTSRTSCLSESFMLRCDAMVSPSFPGSSMDMNVTSVSEGILLLSLT